MKSLIVFYPIIFHFLLTIILMFSWLNTRLQKIVSIIGNVIGLGLAIWFFAEVYNNGILVGEAGNWTAPFGIVLVADNLAVTMILLTSIAGLAVSTFSAATVIEPRLKFGYYPILQFLILGLIGAFLTGDIFNLYVWFEVIILSSFVLLTLGGEKNQLEGALKYFTLNMIASAIFLTGIAILYGLTGSLNMADLSIKMQEVENQGLVSVCALFFFIAFGIKSAVFPLYFWLPASYHTPPSAVGAIFAGLLTKLGIYALLRTFSLIFYNDDFIMQAMVVIAILTMITGAAGAIIQTNLKKIFSYLIICHIGFMIAGIAMFTQVALTGVVFYLIHDIIVKTNLFLLAGLIFKIAGTNELGKLGGLYKNYPLISFLLAIPLFSLVGIPPLSGFWPKISLIQAGLDTEQYILIGTIIFASFITLFIVARIWAEAFWKNAPEIEKVENLEYYQSIPNSKKTLILGSIGFLAIISLYIGFGAEHIQVLSEKVSIDLVDQSGYIKAVLNK
ncbi:MAG: proton-conducting transporter transmembrane domain-containing protein [Luteibaculaceae bacterium]